MGSIFEERRSDSPFVESVWRFQSDSPGQYTSIAASHWSFLIIKAHSKTHVMMCGPETKATVGNVAVNAEVFGINFKTGVFMPHLLPGLVVNDRILLPGGTRQSFWLHGQSWRVPDFGNADTFADTLIREHILARDPLIETILQDYPHDLSPRAAQYRFLHATGLAGRTARQILRAREAVRLLREGRSILDTVYEMGYFDQAHMTHSLKRLMGQTPTEIARTSSLV